MHNIHQHAAARIHQAADMKRAMADAAIHRRNDAGIAERDSLSGDPRLRLLDGGGGDIALHARVINIITANRLVIF